MACLCLVWICLNQIIPNLSEIRMRIPKPVHTYTDNYVNKTLVYLCTSLLGGVMTLWGGRFSTKLNDQAWDLNSSLPIDKRLAIQDVEGSLAWSDALHHTGILSDKEHA